MNIFESDMIHSDLKKALNKINFNEPTEIQKKVIEPVMAGSDIMATSETGSGKTGAYGIPVVQMLIENPQASALILAPTRELVQQISEFLNKLNIFRRDVRVVSLVGGMDIRRQLMTLRQRPRLIVATPGRLIDHITRRSVNLKMVKMMVLDEGDRMLDMGFAPQLDEILKYLPAERQTLLFTATLPKKVEELAATYLKTPLRLSVGTQSRPVSAIKQSLVKVMAADKDNQLVDELNVRTGQTIIFVKTQRKTEEVAYHLKGFGFDVEAIHGGRTQGQRNMALKNFRAGKSRILCATDVAARGLDIPEVEHVINYDIPMMHEDYVHRIGRTARNGADGEAVSFVTPQDYRTWSRIARVIGLKDLIIPGTERPHDGKRGGRPKRGGQGAGGFRLRRNSFESRSEGESSSEGSSGGYRKRNFPSSFSSRSKNDSDGGEKPLRKTFFQQNEGGTEGFSEQRRPFRKKTMGNGGFVGTSGGAASGRPSSAGSRRSKGGSGFGGSGAPRSNSGQNQQQSSRRSFSR